MANKLIDMSKVRKVIQLHSQGKSKLFISKYLSLSRNTVKKYIALYQLLNFSIEDIKSKSDSWWDHSSKIQLIENEHLNGVRFSF
jgi:hypothetical protein